MLVSENLTSECLVSTWRQMVLEEVQEASISHLKMKKNSGVWHQDQMFLMLFLEVSLPLSTVVRTSRNVLLVYYLVVPGKGIHFLSVF